MRRACVTLIETFVTYRVSLVSRGVMQNPSRPTIAAGEELVLTNDQRLQHRRGDSLATRHTTGDRRRCSGAIERPATRRFALRSSPATSRWRPVSRGASTRPAWHSTTSCRSRRSGSSRPSNGTTPRTAPRSRRSPCRRSAARSSATSVITPGACAPRETSRNARSRSCGRAIRYAPRPAGLRRPPSWPTGSVRRVEEVLEGLYAGQARDGDPIEQPADDHDDGLPHRDSFGVEDSGYEEWTPP